MTCATKHPAAWVWSCVSRLVGTLAPLALLTCGSPTNDAELCTFDVKTQAVATQAASKLVSMSADLPSSCQTLTRDNSGKLIVEVTVSGPKDEGIVLQSVQAGDRDKSFDPVANNLKAGRLDTQFSSQSEPEWTVPWSDSPQRFVVALLAPLNAPEAALPQKATVRLSL